MEKIENNPLDWPLWGLENILSPKSKLGLNLFCSKSAENKQKL
jgi:hypothetical protein